LAKAGQTRCELVTYLAVVLIHPIGSLQQCIESLRWPNDSITPAVIRSKVGTAWMFGRVLDDLNYLIHGRRGFRCHEKRRHPSKGGCHGCSVEVCVLVNAIVPFGWWNRGVDLHSRSNNVRLRCQRVRAFSRKYQAGAAAEKRYIKLIAGKLFRSADGE